MQDFNRYTLKMLRVILEEFFNVMKSMAKLAYM